MLTWAPCRPCGVPHAAACSAWTSPCICSAWAFKGLKILQLLPHPLSAATGLIFMTTWALYKEGSRVAPFLAASVPGALAVQVQMRQRQQCKFNL